MTSMLIGILMSNGSWRHLRPWQRKKLREMEEEENGTRQVVAEILCKTRKNEHG